MKCLPHSLTRHGVQLQEFEEKLVVLSRPASSQPPSEVACLAHLERHVEVAGSSIIVIAFYSRVSSFIFFTVALTPSAFDS